MGNRVTVSLESQEHEAPINIYAHWAGDDIYSIVQQALENSDRIGDASYLSAQVIHAVFTNLGYNGRTSFGIWTGSDVPLEDDNPTMFVDLDTGKWRIGQMDWQDRSTAVHEALSAECAECGDVGVVSYEDKDGEALGEPCPNCKESK